MHRSRVTSAVLSLILYVASDVRAEEPGLKLQMQPSLIPYALGRDDQTDLSGLNVAMAITTPGTMVETKWRAALYLDARASDPQKQALTRIFAGKAKLPTSGKPG